MKGLKVFAICVAACIALAPAAAMAKGPKVSFSFNFDTFSRFSPPPRSIPVYQETIFVPCPPPPQQKIVVKEYHIYHDYDYYEVIQPKHPRPSYSFHPMGPRFPY